MKNKAKKVSPLSAKEIYQTLGISKVLQKKVNKLIDKLIKEGKIRE